MQKWGLSAHCPYDNRSDCAERVSVPADPDTELFHHPYPFGYYEVSGVENYVQMFGNKEFWKGHLEFHLLLYTDRAPGNFSFPC